jgi:hypothetical protein
MSLLCWLLMQEYDVRVVKASQEQQQIRERLLGIMMGLVRQVNTSAGVRNDSQDKAVVTGKPSG